MPRPEPIYVLAADHRWQWHDWCDAHGKPRDVIPELKRVVVDGFLAARGRSAEVQKHGAMLLDEQYAADGISRLRREGVAVAAPVEKPGVFPLEWTATPFWRALTGSMGKVLVRYRPDYPPERLEAERRALRELSDWCRANAYPWMLEVVVPAADGEREEEFARDVRPGILARYIDEASRHGIAPDYWKMEGTTSAEGARVVDDAIRRAGAAGFLVLGKAAPLETVGQWFRTARAMDSASGFAIGRSIYWEPAARFTLGEIGRDEAVAAVADTYLETIELWSRSA